MRVWSIGVGFRCAASAPFFGSQRNLLTHGFKGYTYERLVATAFRVIPTQAEGVRASSAPGRRLAGCQSTSSGSARAQWVQVLGFRV